MSDNPYAPPSARVADAEPAGSIERPLVVMRAVYLLWASFALELPGTIYGVIFPDPDVALGEEILISIFSIGVSLAFSYWLNIAAWKGRGYARWVLAALEVLVASLIWWVERYYPMPETTPWYIQSINVLSWIVAILGTVMLFAPTANAWYRAMRASR